jgi:hypothetical protein
MTITKLQTSALICTLLSAAHCIAADQPAQGDSSDATQSAEMAEMMEKWQEVATPGKPHEVLKPLEGKWNTVTKMWMAGPEGPATESKGATEYKWVLGGRYLQQTYEGQLMGMPMSGIGLLGYDNYKKKYTSCWIDSASTAMLTSEGLLDRTGKVITLFGTMDEWLTGEHDKAVKYVIRMLDEDKHLFELHDLGIVDGDKEDTKVLEITYTRRK